MGEVDLDEGEKRDDDEVLDEGKGYSFEFRHKKNGSSNILKD
jgi:hypothetical protein